VIYIFDYTIDFLVHGRVMCSFDSSGMELDELVEISCDQFLEGRDLLERLATSKPQIELEMREKLEFVRDEWQDVRVAYDECKATIMIQEQETSNSVPVMADVNVIFSVAWGDPV